MKQTNQEHVAVIGHPVSHSLSPIIHGAAFEHLGIQASYERLDVTEDQVSEVARNMRDAHMRQFAVTIPNKEAALKAAHSASEVATFVGAANTLTRHDDGTIHADNTDWIGVRDSLREVGDWDGKKVLILGAGGASRGTIYALQELGMDIYIKNRTRKKAEVLAKHFDIQLGKVTQDYDLIINATSVGLNNAKDPENVGKTPISKRNLHRGMTVFDTVMNPLETRLLREAKERGCRTIDGMRMLVYQGIEQLRIWTEVIDPELSHKVQSQKKELSVIMRAAGLKQLGVVE